MSWDALLVARAFEHGLPPDGEFVRFERRWLADVTSGFDERTLNLTAWVARGLRDRSGSPERRADSRYLRKDLVSPQQGTPHIVRAQTD